MAFNVIYADKNKIKSSIKQGIIPKESLILTTDENQSEAYYYDDVGKLKYITKKHHLVLYWKLAFGLLNTTMKVRLFQFMKIINGFPILLVKIKLLPLFNTVKMMIILSLMVETLNIKK